MSVTRWDEDANPEQPWFECSIDQLATLRDRALNELGESPAVVNGLVGWIVGADANVVDGKTRAKYRAILREVGRPSAPRGRRGRIRAAGQRGATRLNLVGAGAATGAAVLTLPLSPAVAAVSFLAAPIILDTREAAAGAQNATQRLFELAAAA